MSALKNQRHELFAQAVASGKTADEAYQHAGYKPSRNNASRLRANDIIGARVAEILAKAGERVEVDKARVLAELAIVAFSDMKTFAEWGYDSELTAEQIAELRNGALDVPASKRARDLDTEARKYLENAGLPIEWRSVDLRKSERLGEDSRAVQSVSESQHGVSIKLHDKMKALELIGKYFRMFVEKVEHSGENGGPIEIAPVDLTRLSVDELQAMRRIMAKAATKV